MPWSKIRPDEQGPVHVPEGGEPSRILTYSEAIREALEQAMENDPAVFVMGQGVDDPTGMFGTTLGLQKKYGAERVFDTPLAETALTGVAVGAAIGGRRPVYMHNRPDFLLLAMDQIVNHAAKWHFMFGGRVSVPMVVWACIGRGWGSAAQHSQALQGLFLHIPGLHLVMPSNPHDAKGLLLSAIANPDPVIVLEHRLNFRRKGHVPADPYKIPLGKGVILRPGKDVTLVGVSHMTAEALCAADGLAREGIDAEVIDSRSLHPLDEDLILASVRKTGRAVVADTGWRTGGVTAELSALISEKAYGRLLAPVRRVACPDVPTPAGYTLEQAFYPGSEEIMAAVRDVLSWRR